MKAGIAVFVMGAAVYQDRVSPEFAARLLAGLDASQDTGGEYFICGFAESDFKDKSQIDNFLRVHAGDKFNRTYLSETQNTRSSVVAIKKVAVAQNWKEFVVVSSHYHGPRIVIEGRRNRLKPIFVSPLASPESLNNRVLMVRRITEAIAILFYLLPSAITSRVNTGPGSFRRKVPAAIIKLLMRWVNR